MLEVEQNCKQQGGAGNNISVDIRMERLFLNYFFKFFLTFYFIFYSKVQQLQQLQLLSQSIHAQTYYTPKHTCNSTITTQGNAYCYFTSAIQKRRN